MNDIGKISEIEPEDGLGWIELEDASRVRFGVTSCKGFVPAVGMVVRVLGTKAGYGGVLKATELERVADAPKTFAQGAAPGAPPAPRTSLHDVQSSGVRADDLLLTVLGRADVDPRLHADLEAIAFHVKAAPGLAIGCKNPWFFAIAKDAGGDAYGIYAHPMFDGYAAHPWVLWRHETGTLRWIANDASDLLPRVLATAAGVGVGADILTRLRSNLVKLGMADAQGAPIGGGAKAAWLPPDDAELRSLDEYFHEQDGGEMDRGLLAHAYRRGDARALEALRSLYIAWEWKLPSWAG